MLRAASFKAVLAVLSVLAALVPFVSTEGIASAAPGAPSGLSPNGTTEAANPVLRWEPVADAVAYRVQVSTGSSFGSVAYDVQTRQRNATPQVQLPAGTLYWRVQGIDGGGVAGAWSTASFTRVLGSAPVPSTPAEGDVLSFPTEPPVFTWVPVAGATSYTVQVDDASDFVGAQEWTSRNPQLTLSDPQAPQTWFWRVRATLGNELVTPWSATRSYSVQGLDAPVGTTPADGLSPSIIDVVLGWTPVNGAATYRLQVSTDDQFNTLVTDTVVKSTRWSPATTLNNDDYWWRVRAFDQLGNPSPWSPVRQFRRAWTAQPVLLHPADTLNPPVGDPFYFEWSPAAHASSYRVDISTDSNFSPQYTSSCQTTHTTLTLSMNPGTGGCTPQVGVRTYWRVVGLDEPLPVSTQTTTSQVRSFVYDPGRVTQLSPADGATVQVPTMRWEPVSGADRYRVSLYRASSAKIGEWTTYATSFTPFDKLNPADGPFRWTVQAVQPNGATSPLVLFSAMPSFAVSGSPADTETPTPLSPAPGAGSTRAPALSWTPVTGAAYYRVYVGADGSWFFSKVRETFRYPAGTTTATTTEDGVTLLSPGTYAWFVEAYASDGTPIGTGPTSSYTIAQLDAVGGQRLALTGSGTDDADVNCTAELDPAPAASPLCPKLRQTPVLRWDAVPSAGYYMVYLSRDRDYTNLYATWSTSRTMFTPPESLPDSQAGAAYYWFVRPCKTENLCGPLRPAEHAFEKRSNNVLLLAPGDGAQLPDQVTFSWRSHLDTNTLSTGDVGPTPTEDAKQYRILVSTQPTFANLIDQQYVDQTTYTAPYGTYPVGPLYWKVQTVDGSGNLLASSAVHTLTKRSAAIQPTVPAEPPVSVSSTPTLRWQPQAYAVAYDVQIYKNTESDPHFSPFNLVDERRVRQAAYARTEPLAPLAEKYAWRIRPVDTDGRVGDWTEMAPFRVTGVAPNLVSPLAGTAVDRTDLVFRWSAVPGASSYRFERRSSTGATSNLEDVATVSLAWAPTELYADGSYVWRVTARDPNGGSMGTSPWRSVTVDGTVPAVTSKSSSLQVDSKVVVTFSEPVNGVSSTTFTLREPGAEANVSATVSLSADRRTATLAPSSYLVPGTPYTARLSAGIEDDGGNPVPVTTWTAKVSGTVENSNVALRESWDRDSSSAAFGGGYAVSAAKGATARLTFTGSSVTLYGVRTPSSGKATVRIDGGTAMTVDLYAASTVFKSTLLTRTGLSAGSHTLTVTVSGAKRLASKGYDVAVDAAKAGAVLVDGTQIGYAHQSVATSSAYGGGYDAASLALPDTSYRPAWASTVYGSTISLYMVKGSSSGKAQILVDGATVATVDLYAASTAYKAKVFSKAFTKKKHTVEVRVTGSRNARSSGTWVRFDRLTIA